MTTENSASRAGRELYHAIWKTVGERFYDLARLADWSSWEHRFDDAIDSEETAIRLAKEAIASLGDPYTLLRLKPQHAEPSAGAALSDTGSEPSKRETVPNVTALMGESKIGYLRILSFEDAKVVEQLQEGLTKISGCNGLVVDLRNNPGGYMDHTIDCCELFLRSGAVCTVETRVGDGIRKRRTVLKPDVCVWNDENPDGSKESQDYKRLAPLVAGRPIAFLLSPITASAAELFVCALVINGFKGMCTTVGRTTLGKGIGQSEWIDVLGKVELRISICRWLVPTGEWLGDGTGGEDAGIDPEFVVTNDRGPEALEVAVAEVKKMIEALRRELGLSGESA